MQKVEKLLKTNIKKYKIEDKIRAYEVVRSWEKIISDLLPEAAGKTMALSLERGVLKVASLTGEIAELIRMLQKRILYAINSMFAGAVVYRIECCI